MKYIHFAIIIILCSTFSDAIAQYIIPDSIAKKVARGIPENENVAYQRRNGDNRWEGLCTKKIIGASSAFTVVSLTRGKVTFSTNARSNIPILPPDCTAVWITAVNTGQTSADLDYRLDIVAENGRPQHFAASVIIENHLKPADLGFIGFKYTLNTVPKANERIYVPIKISSDMRDNNIFLTVVSNIPVENLMAELIDTKSLQKTTFIPTRSISFEHDEPITFEIPNSQFTFGNSYTINLNGQVVGTRRKLIKTITFDYIKNIADVQKSPKN